MRRKIFKYIKFIMSSVLIVGLIAPSYASLSASDGSAFVTKAEFDSALADFNTRLTTFEAGINSKIDSQVTSYLDRNGIWNGKVQETPKDYISFCGGRRGNLPAQTNALMKFTAVARVGFSVTCWIGGYKLANVNKSGLIYAEFVDNSTWANHEPGTTQTYGAARENLGVKWDSGIDYANMSDNGIAGLVSLKTLASSAAVNLPVGALFESNSGGKNGVCMVDDSIKFNDMATINEIAWGGAYIGGMTLSTTQNILTTVSYAPHTSYNLMGFANKGDALFVANKINAWGWCQNAQTLYLTKEPVIDNAMAEDNWPTSLCKKLVVY